MDLTDAQWSFVESLIPTPPRRPDRRGRPWRDPRDVLNGILWILRTGAPWKDLPWTRFQKTPEFQAWLKTPGAEEYGNKVGPGVVSAFRASWKRQVR